MVSKLDVSPQAPHLGFRAVLFRMVSKQLNEQLKQAESFRAVLFRMVSKRAYYQVDASAGFRAVLFRMVSKLRKAHQRTQECFRAVLFRMVSKPTKETAYKNCVLELCCFEWFQNVPTYQVSY